MSHIFQYGLCVQGEDKWKKRPSEWKQGQVLSDLNFIFKELFYLHIYSWWNKQIARHQYVCMCVCLCMRKWAILKCVTLMLLYPNRSPKTAHPWAWFCWKSLPVKWDFCPPSCHQGAAIGGSQCKAQCKVLWLGHCCYDLMVYR